MLKPPDIFGIPTIDQGCSNPKPSGLVHPPVAVRIGALSSAGYKYPGVANRKRTRYSKDVNRKSVLAPWRQQCEVRTAATLPRGLMWAESCHVVSKDFCSHILKYVDSICFRSNLFNTCFKRAILPWCDLVCPFDSWPASAGKIPFRHEQRSRYRADCKALKDNTM